MNKGRFFNYLKNLGYSDREILSAPGEDTFIHVFDSGNRLTVKYILTPNTEKIFENHKSLWNRNSDNIFLAVGDKKTFLINVTEKPDSLNPLKKSICLKTFNYGVNSEGFEDADIEQISKSNVDSAYFFDFIIKNQRKGQAVDKDLLLNLLSLKNDLLRNKNYQIIHLLILRCLFVKYLEDRGIFDKDYLLSILKTKKPAKLISAFDEICKINGDIFKYNQLDISDIHVNYLDKLALFFETDYRSGQQSLFPYQFDKIPIQLISHVYEAFLKGSIKKGKGIYYTPPFLVNFLLSQTLLQLTSKNPNAKVLDPAVGSGAFLVESFRMIHKAKGTINFSQKKQILETQLFGIDNDQNALQIAAFSLYLALLETEDPEFIKNEIKYAHPILPSLIGKNLINGNTITDSHIFNDVSFDCIVSNPPWGAVSADAEGLTDHDVAENEKEREAIDNKNTLYPEYNNVANYERSQAFIMRVSRWCNRKSVVAMVVKNSIFLNDKTLEFRNELLNKYKITKFYELSHYNKILFKKNEIGIVGNEKIELGASEPCAVIFFQVSSDNLQNCINYISPKLSQFAEYFEIIQFAKRDKAIIKQQDFLDNDLLWRVLVNGDFEDFNLVKKIGTLRDELEIICSKGFEPQHNEGRNKESYTRSLIKSEDFSRYKINNKLQEFNWNQKLRRTGSETLYSGDRILIANRPKPSDNFRLRALFTNKEIIFRNDIFGLKISGNKNVKAYLGLVNSSLFGYFLFHNSVQWFGGSKRDSLRKSELINLPFIDLDRFPAETKLLIDKIRQIEKVNTVASNIESEIDEIVFDLYGLLDYEREIVREFYKTRVERIGNKLSKVQDSDIEIYFISFKQTFSLILSPNKTLNASFHVSPNIGAVICISIVDVSEGVGMKDNSDYKILNFVKEKQLKKSEALRILNEDKVKIYELDRLYIVKSNYYKDWTVRQAIRDAKEEIDEFIKQLPIADEHSN